MNDDYLWVERYRPKKIADCILPPRLKKVFQEYANNKTIPNLMLTGSAGVGKTTVAKALCDEVGCNHLFMNASKERGIGEVRETITKYASTISLTGGRKVIILDEADYLTNDAQASLRGTIEEFADNCSFIFTCNFKSRLIEALHSRCSVVDFSLRSDEKPQMAASLFKRLENILSNEGVQYDEKVLAAIIKKFFPDYRRTLNELQRYSATGNLDAGVLAQISDVRKISELVGFLKNNDFTGMRKWVVSNLDIDHSTIFRRIYESLAEYFKPESIPQAIVILARYQYQAAFVADQEINLVSCLTELMVECRYV